jgi:polar amino acid transport system substrate-binding protein
MLIRINSKFYEASAHLKTQAKKVFLAMLIVLIAFVGSVPATIAQPNANTPNALDRMYVDRGAAATIPDVSKQAAVDRMYVDRGAARTFSSSEPVTQVKVEDAVPAIPADIDRVLKRGELIIAMLGIDNSPFFERTTDGKLSGLDVDLGRSIAEELGVKVRFDRSPKTFNAAVDLVQQQKADLAISKLSISLKRARQVKFSQPYVTMRQGLLVNRLQLAKRTSAGLTPEEAIKNLDGKVGVIKGTQYSLFARRRFPKATVVEFPKWDDVINAVGKGDILAAFRDELEIKKVVLKQPNFALQVQTVAFSDTTDLLAVIGHWQSSQLIDFVNYDLSLNKLSYTADQLIKRYEGSFRKEESH